MRHRGCGGDRSRRRRFLARRRHLLRAERPCGGARRRHGGNAGGLGSGGSVVAGGGWYDASRWFAGKGDSFVETIPKYINTPIDVLGAALVDLLGSLALRVAAVDGVIDPRERDCIVDHFVEDWGLDAAYVARALETLAPLADNTRVKTIARDLARFAAANPDCNASAMQTELMTFLHDLTMADGVLDEREELALDAIALVLDEEGRLTLAKAGTAATETLSAAGSIAGTLAGKREAHQQDIEGVAFAPRDGEKAVLYRLREIGRPLSHWT